MAIGTRRLPTRISELGAAPFAVALRLLGTVQLLSLLGVVDPAAAQVGEVGNRLLTFAPQVAAQFGAAVAVGDFDGDGLADLAVGSPGWDAPSGEDAGLIVFYRGSASREPAYLGATYGFQNGGVGASIAFGDFDGDGLDEIAVGMPGRDVDFNGIVRTRAGAVLVFGYQVGTESLVGEGLLSQQGVGAVESPEENDAFGATLETGDFNGDGYDDLAVGVPYEDVGFVDAGAVEILFGSAAGLDGAGAPARQSIAAGIAGVAGAPGHEDYLGHALASGDFDGDGYADLAIGAPGRSVAGAEWAGEVNVLHGSSGGLTTADQRLFSDSSFIGRAAGAGEAFGAALAAGDFDGQLLVCFFSPCYDDLAIGIPFKTIVPPASFPINAAGEVLVVKGQSTGFGTSVGQYSTLSQLDVAGAGVETGDSFGRSLASGRLDGGTLLSTVDLAVGAPTETIGGGPSEEGFVQLFFGSSSGLDGGAQEQTFGERAGFAVAPPQAGDTWGEAMAIGDLDGDGWGDLVVGVPRKTAGGLANAGAVQILYGALFSDAFECGGTGDWSAP